MARVVVSQRVFPESLQPLPDAGHDLRAREADTPADPGSLRDLVAGADALVCLLTDRIDADLLEAAPDLGVVASVAVGTDHIDVTAATRAGVLVCNTPGVLTEATADLAFALILAAARRIPEGDAYLRAGRYTRWELEQPQQGLDVHGRSLGLFGCGEIGQAVARRASRGFDMEVRYHTRTPLPAAVEADIGARHVDLDELLATSDVLSLHAPLTEQTRHVIDAAALARMKPSAILVNTARGPLVDEGALARALADGTIAGAGIDVYEDEPAVHPDLLAQTERVVLLPHLGSATATTRRRMADMAVANVLAALAGDRPPQLVNPEVLEDPARLRGAVAAALHTT